MINKQILRDNAVIGVVGCEHSGKSNLMFNILDYTIHNTDPRTTNIYFYSYSSKVINNKRVINVSSVKDINACKDGFIFIDEFKFLFQLDNRKFKGEVDKLFNFMFHQNCHLVLCGTEQQYNKFISSKVKAWYIKECNIKSFINGSMIKDIVTGITKDYVGPEVVKIPIEKYYFKGNLYQCPYLPQYDVKKDNKKLI